uniref:Leishmanolysin-like peptidase n=1 Tax=Haemonchus contortus TaxID=6289 RepID=A0A7I4YXD3_HAECO
MLTEMLSALLLSRLILACDYKPPKPEDVMVAKTEHPSGSRTKRESSWDWIRIRVEYDNIFEKLNENMKKKLRSMVRSALHYIETTVKVRPLASLQFPYTCSGKSRKYKNKTICDGQCEKRCYNVVAPQSVKYFECCSCLNPEMECTDHSDCGGTTMSRLCLFLYSVVKVESKPNSQDGEKLVDTDYVLFVSALASSCSGRTIAFATSCKADVTYRPIAGNLNICPQKLKESTQKLLDAWQRVLVHEIIHALAFSVYLFPYYPGAGKPQWDELGVVIPNVVHRFTRFDWETSKGTVEHHVHMIVTPKVREEARRHFNCSTLEGAELENQDAYEGRGSHWEKRVFGNELMTGEVKDMPVISRLSLALLEDSGWYKVNYDNAEDLEWGKNLGCTFATKSCLTWMKLNPSDPYPFCTVYGGDRCAAKRFEKLQCNLVTASKISFKNITPEYDYNIKNLYHDRKGQSVVGFGKVKIADFCPYYMSTAFVANVTPICTRPVIAKLEEDPFQIHSLTSRCLDMNISVKVDSEVSKFTWMRSVGCFESICKNNLLMIRTQQSKFYPCYREGQIIHIEKDSHGKNTSELQIVCPSCLELCGPQFCSTEKFEMESIGDEQRTVFKSVKNFKFGTQVMLVSLLMLFVGDW